MRVFFMTFSMGFICRFNALADDWFHEAVIIRAALFNRMMWQ